MSFFVIPPITRTFFSPFFAFKLKLNVRPIYSRPVYTYLTFHNISFTLGLDYIPLLLCNFYDAFIILFFCSTLARARPLKHVSFSRFSRLIYVHLFSLGLFILKFYCKHTATHYSYSSHLPSSRFFVVLWVENNLDFYNKRSTKSGMWQYKIVTNCITAKKKYQS